MRESESFSKQCNQNIAAMNEDKQLRALSQEWIGRAQKHKYSYNFKWLGRPIIQYPQDIIAMQELIWSLRPDLIIETGIAHGGSLIFSASMLAQLDLCDAIEAGTAVSPIESSRLVIGIDIDIREHNRDAIDAHPMRSRIMMLQGSSVDLNVVSTVRQIASSFKRILVCLDSNHTHAHTLAELDCYAPLVTPGSYCVVFDTIIENLPADSFSDRPWGPGNNPRTAILEFLESHPEFVIDKAIDEKLMISVAPDGYLRRLQ